MEVIARIHNDFPTKFGLPRQSGLAPSLRSKIVFEPAYRVPEALRGLEGFSYIWLIWGFSANEAPSFQRAAEPFQAGPGPDLKEPAAPPGLRTQENHQWSPTVRPPRLGGNVRMGVFATRSPFRPNPIGLSSVRLEGIVADGENGLVLMVTGADLMDGTPIYDIKPYLPGVDIHSDATDGFVGANPQTLLEVEIDPSLAASLSDCQLATLREILAQDPRPAYHAGKPDASRTYGLSYAGRDIHFVVDSGMIRAF
jgi:tRNA (Thr-GGU) A37 N-methylase